MACSSSDTAFDLFYFYFGPMSNNNSGGADDNRSSLSRNALYAPLIAYEQQTVDPSAYMLKRNNVPSSIRESSLLQFLQSLGELSIREVQDRIQQRAVTLMGGDGIKSRFKKATKQRGGGGGAGVVGVLSNRQRKRMVTNQTKQQRPGASGESERKDSFNILLTMNAQWNIYIGKLLVVTRDEWSDDDASVLSQKLASHLELAGAFVRITACCAHKQWVGREGMIVETTVNTWRMAWIRGNGAPPKLLVVPKHGSQVAFSVRRQDNNNNKNTTNNNNNRVTVVIHG
jgi:RNase P/RNase MRP subunit p29